MPRDIQIGNGSLLLTYDRAGLVRDLYYPYVGMENHAQGHPFMVGVWLDGAFSWIDGEGWERLLDYEDDTLVARLRFVNRRLEIELTMRDAVDFHENLYVREIAAKNLSGRHIDLRVFFHHDFHIYGTDIGDTASYKPEEGAILHYKGRRYFLINALRGDVVGLSQYATGVKEAKGLKGTWVDAEDGVLSSNPVAQGSVDSTCSVHLSLPPGSGSNAYYWMAVGEDWKTVKGLNGMVVERSPEYFIKRTADYWRLWVNKEKLNFDGLPEDVVKLYKRSLLILRTSINNNGAVIASSDSDIQHYYRDTYSYLWPRDGAIVAYALGLAGYPIPAERFFEFCGQIIGRNGFFLHKYNPDGSLASSWHPWVQDGSPSLPIQEDETGLVVWALWEHFTLYRDIEFIKPLYRRLIKSSADFMCAFTDPESGLPMPSYDLWEERLGVHAYTVCAVIAGLEASARFTEAFGETGLSEKYRKAASRMKGALLERLYDQEAGKFLRGLNRNPGGELEKDLRADASLYGLVAFGVFSPSDEKAASTIDRLDQALWCRTGIGGFARYEKDSYQAVVEPTSEVPGNPWVICTLWHAQYLIERAQDLEGLKESIRLMQWVAGRALPSGVLPEQVNPLTGEPVSVCPLTWSHAEYVITVQKYLNKLQGLMICPHCSHPAFLKHEP